MTDAQSSPPPQFALLLHGLIGSVDGAPSSSITALQGGSRRLATLSALTVLDNVVDANEPFGGVDVHLHSWNPELAVLLDSLYGRALRSSSHQPVETAEKARSQAISISRAAARIVAHERRRQLPYTLVLVMRLDLVVGGPVRLDTLSPHNVWFGERCCVHAALSPQHRDAVNATCGALEHGSAWRGQDRQNLIGNHPHGNGAPSWGGTDLQDLQRVVGFCRPRFQRPRRAIKRFRLQRLASSAMATQGEAYVVDDWWFAATSDVVASWREIDLNWGAYSAALLDAGVGERWSHHIWPLHVHDVLNLTQQVRFSGSVRVQLARNAFKRLQVSKRRGAVITGEGSPYQRANPVVSYRAADGPRQLFLPASKWLHDAVGGCPAVRSLDRPSRYWLRGQVPWAGAEPLRAIEPGVPPGEPLQPLPPSEPVGHESDAKYLGLFTERFATMAAQCSAASLPHPVVCCGHPRFCGVQTCPGTAPGVPGGTDLHARLDRHYSTALRERDFERNATALQPLLHARLRPRRPALQELAARSTGRVRGDTGQRHTGRAGVMGSGARQGKEERGEGGGEREHRSSGVARGSRRHTARQRPTRTREDSTSAPPPRKGLCAAFEPLAAEQQRPQTGFRGFHYIAPLRAWLIEVPKSGSSTLVKLLRLRHGADSRGARAPRPGDVSFAVVRHPACRAVSAFREAWARAAWRTNRSRSPCPFSDFPYLLDNRSSAEHRLRVALRTLRRRGSALAGPACGYAYHHMLSQTFFLWGNRSGAPGDPARLPPVTRLLRLESLERDLSAFCDERGAAPFCRQALRAGVPRLNAAGVGVAASNPLGALPHVVPRELSHDVRRALVKTYARDFACLNYSYARVMCTEEAS